MSKKRRIPINADDGNRNPELLGDDRPESEEAEALREEDEEQGPGAQAEGLEPDDDDSDERDADLSLFDREDEQREAEREKAALAGDVAELRQRVDETHDKYLRALADLENYKKRALKERSDLLKYQGEKVLYDMVEIADDLERALSHAGAEPEQFKAGIELIYKNFMGILNKWGVRGETAIGQPFDPNKFNALSKVRVDDTVPGTVVSELKKAYFYKDKLLRPGDVVVSEGSAPASGEEEGKEEGPEQEVS